MNSSKPSCIAARRRGASRRRCAALALVAAGLALGGCERAVPPEAQKCDVVRPALGFALDVPEGWTVRDLGGDLVLEILPTDRREAGAAATDAPEGETPARRDRPGAVVQVTVIEREGTTLEQWADQAGAELIEQQPDLVISSRDASQLADGREALMLVIENPRGLEPQEQRMLLAVTADRAYALIATTSGPETAAVEQQMQVCFDSFLIW